MTQYSVTLIKKCAFSGEERYYSLVWDKFNNCLREMELRKGQSIAPPIDFKTYTILNEKIEENRQQLLENAILHTCIASSIKTDIAPPTKEEESAAKAPRHLSHSTGIASLLQKGLNL